MRNDDKVAEVSRKMELVEMGISAEEEVARKAAEEQERLEQERREQEEAAKNAVQDGQDGQDSSQSALPEAVG